MYKLSNYIVSCEIPTQSEIKDIALFSTRTGNMLSLKSNIFEQLKINQYDEVDYRILNLLIKYQIIIPEEEIEINYILEENKFLTQKKEGISFTIQPTGNCQLGCHYCGQTHSKIKMTDILVEKTFQRIKKTVEDNKYKLLGITWYGGEPLLASSNILSFSDKIVDYCITNNITYQADIISNGLLLKPELFKTLITQCKINNYQITLDGIKEFHDKRRMTKGGEGSFDIIMKNIYDCINSDVFNDFKPAITIRININHENVSSVESLIDHFNELDILKKVSFAFSPVFDWGGNKANKESLKMDDFSNLEIDWMLKIHDLGGNVNVSLPERQAIPCMVGNKDSEVIDAFGNIFSCYELPYTQAYQNDKYIEGNLLTDKPENKKNEMREFFDNIENKKYSNCIDCNFYAVCAGACPKSWINGDVACPSFKFNMEDKMLLHYYLTKSNQISNE
jgi:uncharacterized protein